MIVFCDNFECEHCDTFNCVCDSENIELKVEVSQQRQIKTVCDTYLKKEVEE